MNIKRLELLVTLLNELQGKIETGTLDKLQFKLNDWERDSSCGTVACAIGYAMHDERFNDDGLHGDANSPRFNGYVGWAAVGVFFGIEHYESVYLLDARSYCGQPQPIDVAKRITQFIEEGHDEH